MGVILKLSLLNITRHKDRAAFTIIGLGLAIGVLFFVYTIGISYQDNVSTSFNYLTRDGINLWVTPIHGFTYDQKFQTIFANGSLPYGVYTQISGAISNGTLPSGTTAYAEVVNTTTINGKTFVVWGTTRLNDNNIPLQAYMNQQAASALGISISQQFSLAGQPVVFAQALGNLPATGNLIIVPLKLAYKILNQTLSSASPLSWVLVNAPFFKTAASWISHAFNMVESTSPNAVPTPSSSGIVFVLPAGFTRFQVVSFSSQLSAISVGKVVNTAYGLLANICLGLGFVLVVSTAILNIEERRRELGMWSAVGIAEDTFFVFLIESVLVYAMASVIGVGIGILFSALFAPWTLSLGTIAGTSLAIVPYFPTLVIVGSLIPLQLLLNKKPLDLLLKR